MKKYDNLATFEPVEPRILFSADGLGGMDANLVEPMVEEPAIEAEYTASDTDSSSLSDQENDSINVRNEIVFIDENVEGYEQLVDDLFNNGEGRNFEIFIIQDNGLDEITSALEGAEDVDAIHIIAHGDEGQINIGNSTLTTDTFNQYADTLSSWSSSLDSEADILIYGCNVAGSENGQQLLGQIAETTGADIAASTDLTGHVDAGGDWVLEYQHGELETAVAITAQGQNKFEAVLVSASFQEGSNGYTGTQDTYIDDSATSSSFGSDSTVFADDTQQQALLRFENIIGSGSNQIQSGSTINSATINIYVTDTDPHDTVDVHTMLQSWSESSTWNSLGNGVSLDDIEASSTALTTIDAGVSGWIAIDVTADLQAIANGGNNYGWIFNSRPAEADNWGFASSEHSNTTLRPHLSVDYTATPARISDINSNLEVHLELDEGSGTTANDSAGADNNGTLSGSSSASYTTGHIGSHALDFSGGSDDLVTVADANNIDFGSGDFTVSTWFNTGAVSDPSGTERLIGKSNGGAGFVIYNDNSGNTNFLVSDGSNTVTLSASGYQNSSWHQVTALRNGDTFELYIDNVLVDSTTQTIGSIDNNVDVVIGQSIGSSSDYNGQLDEIRLYNAALNTTGVAALYNYRPELITDLSSGIELNTDGGNDAYLYNSNVGNLLGGLKELTFEITFASDTPVTGETPLFSYGTSVDVDNILVSVNSSGDLIIRSGGDVFTVPSSSLPNLFDGQQHSIAYSWQSNNGLVTAYVDGQYIDSTTGFQPSGTVTGGAGDGTLVLGNEQDSVGGGFQTGDVFSGTFYDVRIWNDVRSESEIALNYNNKIDSTNIPTGLIANWQMDGFNGSNQVVDIVSGNNLSIAHATGTGFTTSTPVGDLNIDENTSNGTSVGYVIPSSSNTVNDVVTDGLFTGSSNASTQYGVTGTFGDWTVTRSSVDLFSTSDWTSPSGGRVVNLDGASPGTIEQTLSTTAGTQYQVIFGFTGDFSDGENTKDMRVTAGSTSQDFTTTRDSSWSWGNSNAFEQMSFTFTADSSSTTLSFASLEEASSTHGPYITDIQVIPVPQAVSNILASDSSLSYNAATGKFYKFISSSETFSNAQATAATHQINGVNGQLVTIGSSYENSVVQQLASNGGASSIWLGASDQTSEGTWRWQTGGADGDQFWSGDSNGSAVGGRYSNWFTGEPNDAGGNEEYAEMSVSSGVWNDTNATDTNQTIIEWDASQVIADNSFTLTDSAGGRFAINSSTGEITVANGSLLDYETNTSHDVVVQVTNSIGKTYSETITIQVNDVEEIALQQNLPASQTINEDSALTFSTANGNPITVTDNVSSTNTILQVTLTVNDGVINLASTTGINFIEGSQGSSTFVIEGTESDLNAAFEGMTFTPNANFNGNVTFNMQTTIEGDMAAHYTFDSSTISGATLSDQSAGTAYNGTLSGNATIVSDLDRGDVLSLDGNADYVQITGLVGQPANITLAAWINADAIDSLGGSVLSLGSSPALYLDSGGELSGFYESGGSNYVITSSDSLVGTGWRHIALSIDTTNNNMTIYIDGVAVQSASPTAPIEYDNSPDTYIGRAGDGLSGFDFDGKIDDARIYSRAMTSQEILALAQDQSTSANDTVTITVSQQNDAGSFGGDVAATTNEDTATSGTVTFTDTADGYTGNTFAINAAASNGVAAIDNAGNWTYTPSANFNGSDSFTVQVTDDDGNVETQVINITINQVDDAGSYGGDTSASTNEDTATSGTITYTDSADGYTGNTFSLAAQAFNGTATIDTSGNWTYTPNANFNGSDSFTVMVTDDDGNTHALATTITVTQVNDAGSFGGNVTGTTNEDTATSGTVTFTDSADGYTGNTFAINTAASNGVASIDSAGNWTYTPSANFNGSDSFTVQVTDDDGNVETQVINITVTATNDSPVNTVPGAQTVNEDTWLSISGISVNDADGNLASTQLSASNGRIYVNLSGGATISAGANSSSTLTLSGTQTQINAALATLMYRGDTNFNGSDSLTVTSTDSAGTPLSDTDTVNITVNAVNDAPMNNLSGQPQVIASSSVDGATDVHVADIDGDGDVDLVSTSWTDDRVTWFQNDGSGNLTEHTIATGVSGARHAYVADIDGDGHQDIIVSDYENDTVTWYENDGSATPSFTAHTITNTADGAWSSYAIDMDGDGDMDVLSVSIWDDKVAWYENDGSSTPNWTEHFIGYADGGRTVVAGDIDNDGDVDVATASYVDDSIAWFENDGAATPGFTKNTISTNALGAMSVEIADVDNDGDLDLVSASYADNKISWFENDGNADPTFTENIISTNATGARDVTTADMDGDGDLDIISASYSDNKFAWYENDGSSDPSFTEQLISQSANGPRAVAAADMDGDGDIDVVGASLNDDSIGYFENTDGTMGNQSTNEDTPLVFNAANNNLISISDIDHEGSDVLVRLEITNGTLSLSGISGLSFFNGDGVNDAILEFSGSVTAINAALDGMTYTPTTNFNGTASIRIITNDLGNTGSGGALTDDDTISIRVDAVNDAGSFGGDVSATTNEDTATSGTVTFSDSADGYTSNTFAMNTNASNGVASIDSAGNWTYTPSANFNGSDSFTVQVTDDDGNVETQIINITVNQQNDAGSFGGDVSATTNEDTATSGTVTFSDSADGYTSNTFAMNTNASNGVASIDSAGNWTYTPSANFNGSDSFTVQVTDDDGNVETQVINITVSAVNDAPILVTNSPVTVPEESTRTITSSHLNATDVDNTADQIIYTITSTPNGGNVRLNSFNLGIGGTFTQEDINNGLVTYRDSDDGDPASFNFTISDGTVTSTTHTFIINGIAINDAPVNTVPGAQIVNEDTALNITGISVYDEEGNLATTQLTVSNGFLNVNLAGGATISSGTNGSSTLTLSGTQTQINAALATLTYQGNTNFNGSDTLTVLSTDSGGTPLSDTDTVSITVNQVNDAGSFGGNTSATTNEDTATSGTVTFSDSADGYTSNTFAMNTNASNGVASIDSSGNWTYTPSANFNGSDSFTVQVTDDDGNVETQVINITVSAVNDEQVLATNAGATVAEGSSGNVVTTLMLETTDVDNAATDIVYTVDSIPSNGTLYRNGVVLSTTDTFTQADINNNLITYTHDGSQTSSDSFNFTVDDGAGSTSNGTFNWTVSNVNDAPVNTVPGAQIVNEDTALNITGISVNDVDGNLATTQLTVSNGFLNVNLAGGATISSGTNGSSTLTLSGTQTQINAALATLTYQGNTNFNGSDTLTVLSTDSGGTPLSDTDTVSITVNQVNDAGSFGGNTSATTNEDTATSGTVTFSDSADGYTSNTFAMNTNASNGVASIDAAGNWTYTPSANFNGSDSFTVQVTDDDGNVETQIITITVNQQNDAGSFGGDVSATTNEDTATSGTVTFSDSADGYTSNTFAMNTNASNGVASIDAAGNWTYTPSANFNGSDSFTVQVTDDDGNVETQTITITVNQQNDAGSFGGDVSATTNEDTATSGIVTFSDSADGYTSNTFAMNTNASNGVASIDSAGNWTYTPSANFNGSDSFTVQVTDDDGNVETQTITITVNQQNDAGSFGGDVSATTNEDTATSGTVTFSDSADGYTSNTFAMNTNASNGVASIDSAGNWTYTPSANFNGSDSFTVQVTDDDGNVETHVINITIDPVNDAPTFTSTAITSIAEDSAYSYSITTNDIDGDSVTITAPTLPSWLTLIDNGDGTATLSGTPTNADVGDHNVTIQVDDGNIQQTQSFTITVTNTNDAPVINNLDGDTLNYNEDDGSVVIEQGGDAVVSDVDSLDFNGGSLTVAFVAGNDASEDRLSVQNVGTGSGQIGVSGSNITYGGVVIGTMSGGSAGTDLTITFNNNATAAAVSELIQNITYENTDTLTPTTTSRTVDFTLTDGDGGISATQTTTINVSATNDASSVFGVESSALNYTENDGAVAVSTSISTTDVDDTYLESAVVQITGNYVNGQDVLSFTNQNGITGSWNATTGTLSLSGTATVAQYEAALRSITYTNSSENPNTATRTVSFTVNDGDTDSNTQTRDINITAVNDAPINTVPGAQTVNEDTSLSITSISVNDVDGNLATTQLTVSNGLLNVDLSGGATISAGNNNTNTLTLSGTQTQINAALATLSYQGNTNFNGSDTLTVTSLDSDGIPLSDIDTVSITVNQIADAGSFGGSLSGSTNEDTTTSGTVTFSDSADGYTSNTFAMNTNASNGVASIDIAGNWTYTPSANFNGSDSFTIQVIDDDGNVETQVINITVNQVNDTGSFGGSLTGSTNEDTATSGTVTFSDSADGYTSNTFAMNTNASNGVASIDAAGNWTYTPSANFNGTDSFTIQVTDDDGNVETQVINITVNQVNDTGSFGGNLTAITDEDTSTSGTVTFNDSIDGYSVNNFAINTNAGNGVASIDVAGNWTYTPNLNFNGSDSFIIQVTDDDGNVETQAINITINPVNDVPIATDDSVTVNEGSNITINLVTNDVDPEGLLDLSTVTIIGMPSNGILINNNDGTMEYYHDGSETISDSFTYTVNDTSGLISNLATVNITVNPVNDAPQIISNQMFYTHSNGSTNSTFNLVATDPDNLDSSLLFSVSSVLGGQFEEVSNPGVAITSFTQQQVIDNEIQFMNVAGETPYYEMTVSDSLLTHGPDVTVMFQIIVDDDSNEIIIIQIEPRIIDDNLEQDISKISALIENNEALIQVDLKKISSDSSVGNLLNSDAEESIINSISFEQDVDSKGNKRLSDSLTNNLFKHLLLPEYEKIQINDLNGYIDSEIDRITETLEEALSNFRKQIHNESEASQEQIEFIMNIGQITGISLSVGSLSWLLRLEWLFSVLLSTVPSWRSLDPLAVLNSSQFDEESNPDDLAQQDDELSEGAKEIIDSIRANAI